MKPLAVFALSVEQIDIKGVNTLVVGVGKTQSTLALTKHVLKENPSFVMNIGTAGTASHNVGDIIVSNHFVDRNHANNQIPGVPFDIITEKPSTLRFPSILSGKETEEQFTISTGDDFVTKESSNLYDAIDMEAFALAYVCKELRVPFISVKCITDVIGSNSVAIWEERVRNAQEIIQKYFNEHYPTQQ